MTTTIALLKLLSATALSVGLTFSAPPAIAQPKLVSANSHVSDCSKKEGTEKARCERHERMFAKCGAIKGPAHHVCDREFLLANPLECKALPTSALKACEAEVKAMQTCTEKQGRDFITCVTKESGESPMGH